jgi:hypothetical protein
MQKLLNGVVVPMTAGEIAAHSWPVLQAPVPAEISFAQFIVGLTEQAWITDAEAAAWLGASALPATVEGALSGIPETGPDQTKPRLRARARALRPSVIQRSNELLLMMAQSRGASAAQLDDFFRKYAAI